MIKRRAALLAALGSVAAIAGAHAQGAAAPADKPPPLSSAQVKRWTACLSELRTTAAGRGVPSAVFDDVFAKVAPDLKVIEFLQDQPEFRTPVWDYLAALVDEERVRDGLAKAQEHAKALASVSQRFGVDPVTLVAVWGIESDFGRLTGKRNIIPSLATLVCLGPRRQDYFRTELMAALAIIARGDMRLEKLTGSWAGAFGHTQFMPTVYQRNAVDFDGDGRRDVVDSVPDVLASTATFLNNLGWQSGKPWGYEIRLPKGFDASRAGRTKRVAVETWESLGVERLDGGRLDEGGKTGAIILPAGPDGPAFLVFRNFDAFFGYNPAISYALAIALLSDRMRGKPGVQTPWPTTDIPLSRADRREVQALLLRRGYDIGNADGVIGAKTREAIKEFQSKAGLETHGRPTGQLLTKLRGG